MPGRDTFPYWPPASPQRPNTIAGRQVLMQVRDLRINQAPRQRSDDINFIPSIIPTNRGYDLPDPQQGQMVGRVGSNLYDLLMLTEATPRDKLFQMMQTGPTPGG